MSLWNIWSTYSEKGADKDEKEYKKVFSGLAGAAMFLSGCAAAGQPVGEEMSQEAHVQLQDGRTAEQSPERNDVVMAQNEEISYTKVANVSGAVSLQPGCDKPCR